MWDTRWLSGARCLGACIFVVSLVGAGCEAQPSRDAAGSVAQTILDDEGDGDGGEPAPVPEETPLTGENLAAMAAGNEEMAASIVALHDQSAAAVTCEMELTCEVGTPAPVGAPDPVDAPGPVGASNLVAEAAEVVEADVVCGTDEYGRNDRGAPGRHPGDGRADRERQARGHRGEG